MISVAENILSRAKWSFKLHSDTVRIAAPFSSNKGEVDTPTPPKRPPTAYMVFCRENRPNVVKEHPDIRGTELIKILAAKWSALTPPLKKPYEITAREGTIVYGKLHKEFYESLTDDQRDALYKLKVEKRETKKMQKLKRALKESGMPRVPSNAYTIFVQMKAKEIGEIKSGPIFIRQAAEEWKTMSEEGKNVFYEKAKEDKQRYESEVTEWRKKLIEEGNTDLLKYYEEGKHRHRTIASVVNSDISGYVKLPVKKKVLHEKPTKKN